MFARTLFGSRAESLVAGFGTAFVPDIDFSMSPSIPSTLIGGLRLGAGNGAIIGGILGALIDRGTSEEEVFLYANSMAYVSILLCVETKINQIKEAPPDYAASYR